MSIFQKIFYIYATSPAELLALKENDPSNPPNMHCSESSSMADHGWILLKEYQVLAEVFFHDSLIADAVNAVTKAKAKLMSDTTDKMRVLDEAVQKLLCLESSVPVKKATSLEEAYDEEPSEDIIKFAPDDDISDVEHF